MKKPIAKQINNFLFKWSFISLSPCWYGGRSHKLEVISKPHLTPDSCVADLFKMLTYFHVCCAFSSVCAF
jgi:hypothetical protein